MEVQVTPDFQTGPVWNGSSNPGLTPTFANPSAVDVYLDVDSPDLLNISPYGTVPQSGLRLPAGTLIPQLIFSTRPVKVYARSAVRTSIQIV